MKVIRVGNVSAHQGEIKFGSIKGIELRDGTMVNVPVMVLNGTKDGPVLLLTSSQHGPEIQGIEIIRRVIREEVSPDDLKGSVIAIPVANPLAYQLSTYITPYDNRDLFINFPGNSTGSTTQQLARKIFDQAVSKANYVIDMHNDSFRSIPYTMLRSCRDEETRAMSEKMAKATGFTTILRWRGDPYTPDEIGIGKPGTPSFWYPDFTGSLGIPSIMFEVPGWRMIIEKWVEAGVKAVLNIMKLLGMVHGKIEEQSDFPVIPGLLTARRYHCRRGGMAHFGEREPGDRISKDEIILRILNVYGDEVEAIKAKENEYLLSIVETNQAVMAGDSVAWTVFA